MTRDDLVEIMKYCQEYSLEELMAHIDEYVQMMAVEAYHYGVRDTEERLEGSQWMDVLGRTHDQG